MLGERQRGRCHGRFAMPPVTVDNALARGTALAVNIGIAVDIALNVALAVSVTVAVNVAVSDAVTAGVTAGVGRCLPARGGVV